MERTPLVKRSYFKEATVTQVFRGLFDQWSINEIADQITGQEDDCITYIIKEVNSSFIKIGRTKDVATRCMQLQTGNPHELEIMITFKGDFEEVLHYCLHEYRHRGEWFLVPKPLLELMIKFMNRVINGKAGVNTIAMTIFDL